MSTLSGHTVDHGAESLSSNQSSERKLNCKKWPFCSLPHQIELVSLNTCYSLVKHLVMDVDVVCKYIVELISLFIELSEYSHTYFLIHLRFWYSISYFTWLNKGILLSLKEINWTSVSFSKTFHLTEQRRRLITPVVHHLQCCPGIPPKEVSKSFTPDITGWPPNNANYQRPPQPQHPVNQQIIQNSVVPTSRIEEASWMRRNIFKKLTEAQLNSILWEHAWTIDKK